MDREQFINIMDGAKLYDLTQGCSIFTPPWPGEKALEIHFFKRVTGAYGGGQGANGQLLNWSNTVGTHLVGETAFHSGARAISDIPLDDLCGPGVVVDISDAVSDYSLYTPEMITERATVKKGDILRINLRSRDMKHSFYLREYGINYSIKSREEKTVEFVAKRAGSFTFTSPVTTGYGKDQMKGRLVVFQPKEKQKEEPMEPMAEESATADEAPTETEPVTMTIE